MLRQLFFTKQYMLYISLRDQSWY